MKSKLIAVLFALALIPAAFAVDRVTATITITDTAIQNDTFIINGDTRTFKDTVTLPASQVVTGDDEFETLTSLLAHLQANLPARCIASPVHDVAFELVARGGLALSITGAGGYFRVSYSPVTVGDAKAVGVPYPAIPSG